MRASLTSDPVTTKVSAQSSNFAQKLPAPNARRRLASKPFRMHCRVPAARPLTHSAIHTYIQTVMATATATVRAGPLMNSDRGSLLVYCTVQ